MQPRIRDAEPDDAHQLAQTHVAAWQAAYVGILPDDYLANLSVRERTARWREILSDPTQPSTTLLAEDPATGQCLGLASYGPCRDPDAAPSVGELWMINLHPSVWRRGIGSRLHDVIIQRLAAAGFRTATLWVIEENDRARRFYEHHGWKPDGQSQVHERITYRVRELRYVRHLPPAPSSGT
ncbi:MAG TPA: GNAT family N-acetyltransferase [Actinopolymorphaceae bacterium]|jgi:GNAT superfamily N-acetyltransferase